MGGGNKKSSSKNDDEIVIVDDEEGVIDLLRKMDCRMEDMEKKLNRVLQVVESQKKKIGELEKELKQVKEDNKKMKEEFEESRERMNTLAKNKIKPIVVRLSNTTVRDRWTAAFRAKQLFKEKLFINEHLTKTNQDLLYKAKNMKEVNGYKFVWVRDCKVMIRKNETSRIYVIRNVKDLETYMTIRPSLMSDNAEDYQSATSTFSN
ncbi:hypothetical protein WDU94_015637 [Cyamophila willieti]